MQKNSRFFSFLLSYSRRNHIRIRRFEVSRNLVQTGSISIFFIAVLAGLGVGLDGLLKSTTLAKSFDSGSTLSQLAAIRPNQLTAYDYSRPAAADNIAANSGGPISPDETVMDDTSVEKQILAVQTTSNPANIPSIWAHLGKINNEFGFRRNPFGGRTYEFHAGMDIDGERGDIVIATANGTVTKAGWQGGYGNMIEIDHGNGLTTRFGHLSKLNVEIGDEVARGQLIGFVGSTGRSTGPHLHYEMRFNDIAINPRRFLPPEPTELAAKTN